jgi:hypothetical protein
MCYGEHGEVVGVGESLGELSEQRAGQGGGGNGEEIGGVKLAGREEGKR